MKATASLNLSGGRITLVLVQTTGGTKRGVTVGSAPRLGRRCECSGLEEPTLSDWETLLGVLSCLVGLPMSKNESGAMLGASCIVSGATPLEKSSLSQGSSCSPGAKCLAAVGRVSAHWLDYQRW
jgi:hypothetical protein